jgi:hypothetical protein
MGSADVKTVRLACLVASGLLSVSACEAGAATQAPDMEKSCLTYDGNYESAPLMSVKAPPGEARVYLQKTAKACPASGPCPQKAKAFLVAGDQVFVSKEKDGFRCAYYGTAGGKLIAGFLPAGSLAPLDEETQLTAGFLAGEWRSGDQDVVGIAATANGKVHASGSAIWQGMGDPHTGEFEADSAVTAAETVFHDDSCEVHVHRRGNYLLLDDNSQCGGMNVRFQGIYVRGKAKLK